jgi:hypothetical protein
MDLKSEECHCPTEGHLGLLTRKTTVPVTGSHETTKVFDTFSSLSLSERGPSFELEMIDINRVDELRPVVSTGA